MSVSCFSHRKSIGITFHKYFKKIRLWLRIHNSMKQKERAQILDTLHAI